MSLSQHTPFGLGLFARFGTNEEELAEFHGSRWAFSFGGRFSKTILGKEFTIGGAFGRNKLALASAEHEDVAEIYARQAINRWIYLSFHAQYLRSPAPGGEFLAFGMRTHYDF